jgi:hypothetical protein
LQPDIHIGNSGTGLTVPALELACLSDLGLTLFQGYLLARPGFESLPEPVSPG